MSDVQNNVTDKDDAAASSEVTEEKSSPVVEELDKAALLKQKQKQAPVNGTEADSQNGDASSPVEAAASEPVA